jgi:hypothetical protein
MSPQSAQRGEGRLGFVVTLAVVGVAAFLAIKIIPVRIDAYEFREAVREEARYASVHADDRAVRDRILEKAADMKIPIQGRDLAIRRTKNEVIITASYVQPIDLKFTTYSYKFKTEQRAPLF